MRRHRAALIAILLVGIAAAAAAGDMALTRTGELYRVAPSDDGLVLTHRLVDGTVASSLIPQTAGLVTSSVQVGVDELTGSVFVTWQVGEDLDASVELAWMVDGVWSGPYTVAGGDGTAAERPELAIDRATTVVDDEGESVTVTTTFVHMAWWSYVATRDDGSAYLASLRLDATGAVDISEFEPVALSDLLPFGVGCDGIQNAEGLAHPKLFTDPQTGSPHIFATDFSNCVFQILRMHYDVVEDWVGDTKRRRHIVLLGHASMIAANPDLVLSSAKVEVGHALDLVMYWDVEGAVAYVQLDENGVPPMQTLAYGDALSHEQAIEMVRSLVH